MMFSSTRKWLSSRRQICGGFSLVEFSVVLLVAGLMTWSISAAYENGVAARDRGIASAQAELLRDAVRAFALRNSRLPCPDITGTGWEGDAAGNCAATVDSGWLPYRSLGLERPRAQFLAAYAAYRRPDVDPALDADVVSRKERTGNSVGSKAMLYCAAKHLSKLFRSLAATIM